VRVPLLLDLVTTDPNVNLITDDGIVRPALQLGLQSLQVQVSMDVYGLNRTRLVKNRKEVLRFLSVLRQFRRSRCDLLFSGRFIVNDALS
jgi:hypothetical protein